MSGVFFSRHSVVVHLEIICKSVYLWQQHVYTQRGMLGSAGTRCVADVAAANSAGVREGSGELPVGGRGDWSLFTGHPPGVAH